MPNDVSELIYHPMCDHAGRFMRPVMFCHLTDFDIHEPGNGYQISSLLQKPNTLCISISMTEMPRRERGLCRYIGTSDDPSALKIFIHD
jgi:hypothetical protein